MNSVEYHSLSNNDLYEFRLYNGLTKYGYIKEDLKTNKYFIVHPSHMDIEFEVKLEQIVKWNITQQKNTTASVVTLPGSFKSKKAIILGAGASYDFTHEAKIKDDNRLPLTKDLFHDRYNEILQKYSGAYDLSSEILLAKDIEAYFQRQWEKIKRNYDQPLLLKLINTQYYIHDLFNHLSSKFSNNKRSNYFNLIKLVHEYTVEGKNEYFPIISFNYDTLIEEAITRNLQLQFKNINEYIDHANRKILLFKPHGSANWVKDFDFKFMDINYVKQIKHISQLSTAISGFNFDLSKLFEHLKGSIKVLPKVPKSPDQGLNNYYFPWLLIPYKDKDDLMMPTEHESTLNSFLPHIEEFLVIGWKGTENALKKLIVNHLQGKEIKITIVDPDENTANNFIQDYSKLLPKSTIIHIKEDSTSVRGMTFSKYIAYCQNSDDHFFSR